MKGKKGTHVGVVLSFVLFITFLIFMFALIKLPFGIEQKKENSLDIIKEKLVKYISNETTTIFISNSSVRAGEDCLRFSETGLNLAGGTFISKDKDGNTINSKEELDYMYIDWTSSQSFFKVYFSSSGFNSYASFSCGSYAEATIKNIRQSEEILESNIISKLEEYTSNYESLKLKIGVPPTDDFRFQFKYENQTILGEEMENLKKDIYLKNYPIDYLDVDGNKERGNLLIYLW